MSWEGKEETKSEPVVVEAPKEQPKEEPKEVPVETPAEEPKAEPPKEEKTPEVKADEPKMVPEALVGKVAKSIREKGRSELAQVNARLGQLEEENRKLKEGTPEVSYEAEPAAQDTEALIEQKVKIEFLKRQDAYGHQKYGQEYQDALLIVNSQNDPVLFKKIQEAASPADALIGEAKRIAEDLQYGSDPVERETKKRQALEAEIRKQVEAELAGKIAARGNQPTDVQNVRAAGGETRPEYKSETWATSLPK